MTTLKNKSLNYSIYIYLCIYSIFNLFTLTAFPFIHSDEAWLSGLTNEYIRHKTIFVSESFFDLMPRTVHTLKSFYHLLQVPFVALFGNTVFSIRLLSLIAAVITLYFFHKLLTTLKIAKHRALIYTIIFSLNLQFIYAAHFGRQEMVLLMMLTICIYLYYKDRSIYKIALLLGISIGFHPNAFIITAMVGSVLLKDWIAKSISGKQLLTFVVIIGGFAFLHIGATLLANPNFLSEYWAYGQTLSVDALPSSRIINIKDFYLKLYYQVSGTYYIPPMQAIYIIGGLLSASIFIFGLTRKCTHKDNSIHFLIDASIMAIGYNIAIFLIGRYNTTSITFLILPLYFSILITMEVIYSYRPSIKSRLKHPGLAYVYYAFVILIASISIHSLSTEYALSANHTYDEYLSELDNKIDDDAIILGNLNSGFLFHEHTFYDIRNLAYIDANENYPEDTSLAAYIRNRDIDTIIYYEEYDYIHRNQQWEILYGDDDAWYDDMQIFLKEEATLTYEFENSYYGSRIIRFLGDYPWKIYVYNVH